MTKIGSFGGVSFTVSTKKITPLKDIKRDMSYGWENHDRRLAKPLPEFTGPGQETLSYQIILKRTLGETPYQTMKKLESFASSGKLSAFMLGTKMMSGNMFYIESISQTLETIDKKGVINSITADLTLKEYPLIKKTKKKAVSKKTKAKKAKPRSKKKYAGEITIRVGMLNCRSTASLKGRIVKVLRKNQKYKVYGTKKTDILWYNLGSGRYCSANNKYVKYKKV